nr:immunoglobulin heavy chain junction region [Mus musculus]
CARWGRRYPFAYW